MATRMEKATERMALAVLRNISSSAESPLPMERLEKNFYARWPTEGSRFPMNDAMSASLTAAIASKEPTVSGWDKEKETWKTPIAKAWDKTVSETVEEYFDRARRSFAKGQPLEGTEHLTDAVRAALGFIAATQEWPHGTQTDLYDVTTALVTGILPKEDDHVSELLETASEEGINLCSAFAASMGQPASVQFGLFYDSQDGSDEDATMFARRTIELAGRLAKEKVVIP